MLGTTILPSPTPSSALTAYALHSGFNYMCTQAACKAGVCVVPALVHRGCGVRQGRVRPSISQNTNSD